MSTRTKNPPAKDEFIGSLNVLDSLNEATKEKTQLLNEMIDQNPTEEPASMESFRKFAAGCKLFKTVFYVKCIFYQFSFLEVPSKAHKT